MRLWLYDMVPYLPRTQLLAQFRECVLIAKNIKELGGPNHILVNKIMDYPVKDFNIFCNIVIHEMRQRGYKVSNKSITKLEKYFGFLLDSKQANMLCFDGWHNNEYMKICYWNLREKFLCGQKDFTKEMWDKIEKAFR